MDKTASKLRIGKLTPSAGTSLAKKGSRDYPGRISIKATPAAVDFSPRFVALKGDPVNAGVSS